MNREEVNWLLQTIKDAKNAKRFVLAQYERRRISFQLMADVVREQGWINLSANRFLTTAARHSTEYAWGGQALFSYPKASPEADRTMGMRGSGCPVFVNFSRRISHRRVDLV
jgi:hypothetical protein